MCVHMLRVNEMATLTQQFFRTENGFFILGIRAVGSQVHFNNKSHKSVGGNFDE